MNRQDHLMLVTDAGAELHLGWDHGIPYTMDPLNGVPVDLQLAQGVNQVGQTVEDQSVAGVYRQITADCWGPHGDADADLLLRTLTYKTAGTLYFGDQWFCRFVVSKTPYTVQLHGFVRLEMMLFCPKPFWYSLTAASYTLGGFTAAFRFPVNYAQPHRFGIRQPNTFVNCRNTGALPVPFTATLRTDASVVNPCILNVITGQRLRLLTTLTQEQTIEIYRTTTDQLAVKRAEHQVEESVFALLDEDSDLVELAPGDNPLKTEADSNVDNLQATVTFYPMYSGILPEVLA